MNVDRIEAILRLLQRQTHVGELSAGGAGWRLTARKAPWSATDVLREAPGAATSESQDETCPLPISVRAPLVGIFRAAGTDLRPGDFVGEGGTVGQIDSMRILNPVAAAEPGYVLDVLVEDGDPVEYGQELVRLSRELTPESGMLG